jgi:hypothetical protein
VKEEDESNRTRLSSVDEGQSCRRKQVQWKKPVEVEEVEKAGPVEVGESSRRREIQSKKASPVSKQASPVSKQASRV